MRMNDLRAFLAVAQTNSFSSAAESLHLTQPAISKRIGNLERDLGLKLFDRVGKRVYLTDAGSLLEPRAESLLAEIEDTRRLLRNLHTQVDGTLNLATSHHVGLHRLAPVLKSFNVEHAAVQLEIQFEDSEAAHELVRSGAAEFAVVTLNPEGPDELEYQPIWDDALHFVVAKERPLARATSITLAQLVDEPAVLPGMGTYTGRIVMDVFRDRGLQLHPTMSTNYLETLGMLVGAGLGWSVLPESLIGEGVVRIDCGAPPKHRVLGAVTHPNRTLSNAAKAFLQVLRRHADTPEHSDVVREPGID